MGLLQGRILRHASHSKKQVMTSALKMASDARSDATGSIKMQQRNLYNVASSLSKSLKLLRQRTLQTLVATGKAAALNASNLADATTVWENELSSTDIAEAKADLQVMFKSNELLSRFTILKETYQHSLLSGQGQQDATTALADADLATKAGQLKIKQDTCLQVTNAQKSTLRLFKNLKLQWTDIGAMAEKEATKAKKAKQRHILAKQAADVAKHALKVESTELQSKLSAAQIQLNTLRSEATFSLAKVHLIQKRSQNTSNPLDQHSSIPKVAQAERTMREATKKQRLQQQAIQRIIQNKIRASSNLTNAALRAFTADAAVAASFSVQDTARKLLSVVSSSVLNINKEVTKCQREVVRLKRQRDTYAKSAHQILDKHKQITLENDFQFASVKHFVLNMASKSATQVFRLQTNMSRHAATKYRVLRARERLLLKFAHYHEGKANKLRTAFMKSDSLAEAETAAHNGASLAEFQDARSKARAKRNSSATPSVNIMRSSLSTDTAVIAIVDAAQAAAKRNAEKLHKQQHDAYALAARLTLDAKLVRAKIPASIARIRQSMQNSKQARIYAENMAGKLQHLASTQHMYQTKLDQVRANLSNKYDLPPT